MLVVVKAVRGFAAAVLTVASSIAAMTAMTACDHKDEGAEGTATSTAAEVSAGGGAGEDAPASTDASFEAPPPSTATPPLAELDGAPLPQTDAFPSLDSGSFRVRIDSLWRAIVRDEEQDGQVAFFPLVAYEQVKAIPNPAADYRSRLLAAFARDIHKYHSMLGPDAATARFVRVDVPTAKAKWMEPGSEGNKLGYDRVLDSAMVWADASGKEHTLPIKSMISWRGEWYVVHLAGFK